MQTLKESYEHGSLILEAIDLKQLDKLDKLVKRLKDIQNLRGLGRELKQLVGSYVQSVSNASSALDSGINPIKFFKKVKGKDDFAAAVHFLNSFQKGVKNLPKFLKLTLKIGAVAPETGAKLKDYAENRFDGGEEKFKEALIDLFDKKSKDDLGKKIKKFFTGGTVFENTGKLIANSLMEMAVGDVVEMANSYINIDDTELLSAAGGAITTAAAESGGGAPAAGGPARGGAAAGGPVRGGAAATRGGAAAGGPTGAPPQGSEAGGGKLLSATKLQKLENEYLNIKRKDLPEDEKALKNQKPHLHFLMWLNSKGKLVEALERGVIKIKFNKKLSQLL
jgi:hypothetical protein